MRAPHDTRGWKSGERTLPTWALALVLATVTAVAMLSARPSTAQARRLDGAPAQGASRAAR